MVNWTLASGTSQDLAYLPDGQVEGIFNGNGGSTWWYEQYLWVGQRLMAYYYPNWDTYFIHRGANGSSTQITDQSGGLAGDMLFYPFGQEWAYDNGVNSAWWQFYNSFSRWTADLGFDLTPNRKYSPTLGRWMTPDPSGMVAASPSNPQTWNMYAYVLNNPTSLIDTSGLSPCTSGDASSVDIGRGLPYCGMFKTNSIPAFQPVPLDIAALHQFMAYAAANEMSGASHTTATEAGGGAAAGPSISRQAAFTRRGIPWYDNHCIWSALGKGGLEIGIDSIGLFPEAGGVARIIGHQAGYVGVVADQFGHGILDAVGHTAGAEEGILNVGDTSPTGVLSTLSTVASFIPGLNDVTALPSTALDIYKTAMAVSQCH